MHGCGPVFKWGMGVWGNSMKFKLIEMGERGSIVTMYDTAEELIAGMEAKGYEHLGPCKADWLRSELRGQPTFKGIFGPMGPDPDAVRYEDAETNELLST